MLQTEDVKDGSKDAVFVGFLPQDPRTAVGGNGD